MSIHTYPIQYFQLCVTGSCPAGNKSVMLFKCAVKVCVQNFFPQVFGNFILFIIVSNILRI